MLSLSRGRTPLPPAPSEAGTTKARQLCPEPGSHSGAPRSFPSIPEAAERWEDVNPADAMRACAPFRFRKFPGWAGGGRPADTSFTTCCWLVFLFHGRRGCGCKINLRVFFFFFFSPKKSLCCNAGRAQADDIFMGLTLVKTVVSTRANQRVR